jgi:signal transduction histidine kinase/CheY-like chemotaxis protein
VATHEQQRASRADIAAAIAAARLQTLRHLLVLLAIAYLLWQFVLPLFDPASADTLDALLQRWVLLVMVAASLGGAYLLSERRPALAGPYLLAGATLTCTAALWLLRAPSVTFLYGLIVLTAATLVTPLSAWLVGGAALLALLALQAAGLLPFLSSLLLAEAAGTALLAGVLGASFCRTIAMAVEWSEISLERANQNAEEAKRHRGRLVHAVQQLDDTHYRLRQANAALEVAWKAADSAERSKSEFVTNISHELRTPLNLIVGFSEMIVTSPESYGSSLPADYRGDLNAIYRSAQHLLTLTEDVLDLARIGTGRLTLVREPVDLRQTIVDAADIVREYVAAKGLRLQLDVAADLPLVNLDRLRIRQVLLNLITNAARFTERGGITVAAGQDEHGLLVQVIDTGKGIAPLDLPRVFEEFHQGAPGQAGRAARPQGYGLGLPISRRLVELHGGTMGVESVVGVGATFWCRLPVQAAAGSGPVELLRPHDLGWLAGRGDRVLLVAGISSRPLQVLQRQLPNYRLVAVDSFADAKKQACELRAVAILTDSAGIDPTACAGSPAPVIGVPLPHPERLSASFGVTAYLSKPVKRAELLTAIRQLPRPVRTILVIDDDPRFVRLVQRFLGVRTEPAEYAVLSAHNADEGVALALANRPDLILLDLVLPDAGGEQILARLRAHPDLAAAPVIIVSAQEQLPGQAVLGDIATVVKPEGMRLDEICRLVEALVQTLTPPRGYLVVGGDAGATSTTGINPSPAADGDEASHSSN